MQQYRLLRNNRESGPYTWQELVDLGLRAYDLVWAEGMSASWKYPSEMDEFREFAPPVQDDLYIQYHTSAVSGNKSRVEAKKSQPGKNITQRKYVSVILPASRITTASAVQQIPYDSEPARTMLADSSILTRQSSYRKKNFPYPIAVALAILLSGGVYFATQYGNDDPPTSGSPATVKQPVITDLPPDQPGIVQLVSKEEAAGIKPGKEIVVPPAHNEIPTLSPNPALQFASLKRFIRTEASGYSVGFFGGISDLSLRIANTGSEPLHDLVIAVDFIKKNKQIHHTHSVTIPSLKANSSVTVNIPQTNRGIAIQTRITGINGILSQR